MQADEKGRVFDAAGRPPWEPMTFAGLRVVTDERLRPDRWYLLSASKARGSVEPVVTVIDMGPRMVMERPRLRALRLAWRGLGQRVLGWLVPWPAVRVDDELEARR